MNNDILIDSIYGITYIPNDLQIFDPVSGNLYPASHEILKSDFLYIHDKNNNKYTFHTKYCVKCIFWTLNGCTFDDPHSVVSLNNHMIDLNLF